jgi:hypothetical protein
MFFIKIIIVPYVPFFVIPETCYFISGTCRHKELPDDVPGTVPGPFGLPGHSLFLHDPVRSPCTRENADTEITRETTVAKCGERWKEFPL